MSSEEHTHKKTIIAKLLQRRTKEKRAMEAKQFDSSSMGDIAFLLLIFFIVTSSFILRQGIFFSLPSKSSGAQKVEEKLLIQVYPQNEGFLYDEKKVTRDELKKIALERLQKEKDSVFVIYMGEQVKYERLVDSLSLAKESGIERVSVKDVKAN